MVGILGEFFYLCRGFPIAEWYVPLIPTLAVQFDIIRHISDFHKKSYMLNGTLPQYFGLLKRFLTATYFIMHKVLG